MHGRTRDEFYAGNADWDIIRRVKQNVNIPVIGNGDVKCSQDAKKMFDETGCDGIMIGRAALGNPWIFNEIASNLGEMSQNNDISLEDKLKTILEHFGLLIEEKGEYTAVREIRKHVAWYVKGLPEASLVREQVNKCETKEKFENVIVQYFENLS